MSKLYRSLLWAGVVALGVAACGDDVTVVAPPDPPPPPTPGIRSVSVAPDGATIAVGAKLTFTAAVTTDPGAAAPTIAWSSSNTAIASIDAAGVATGVAAGSAGIRATATSGTSTGSGLATLTVGAVQAATVSIQSIEQNGVPVNINLVALNVDVRMNLDRGNEVVKGVELLVDGVKVAEQLFASPSQSPEAAPPELVVEEVVLSFATDALNADGSAKYPNGAHTVAGRVIKPDNTAGQASAGLVLNLSNSSYWSTSITPERQTPGEIDGRVWYGGKMTVRVQYISYSSTRAKTMSGNIFGRSWVAAEPQAGTQIWEFVFPYETFDATDQPLGILDYQTNAAGSGDRVTVTAAVSTTGGIITTVTMSGTRRFVDNRAPDEDDNDDIETDFGENWINATTNFKDYFTAEDGTGVGFVSYTIYYGLAEDGLPGDPEDCSIEGLTMVAKLGDIPQNADGDATLKYVARIRFADALLNEHCGDLNDGGEAFGSDHKNPVVLDFSGPEDGAGYSAAPDYEFIVSDNASGFGATPVLALVVTRQAPSATSTTYNWVIWGCDDDGDCGDETTVAKATATALPLTFATTGDPDDDGSDNAYYRSDVQKVCDQAANCVAPPTDAESSPGSFPRVYANDDVPPFFEGVVGTPNFIDKLGPYSFTALAKDDVDLIALGSNLHYGAHTIRQSTATLGAFGLPSLLSTTATYTLPSMYRCLKEEADLNDDGEGSGLLGNKLSQITLRLFDNVDLTTTAQPIAGAAVNDCSGLNNPANTSLITFDLTKPDEATDVSVSGKTAGEVTSVTIRASLEVSPVDAGLNPFTRVDFYRAFGGTMRIIGSSSAASLTQSGGQRFWLWSISWNPTLGSAGLVLDDDDLSGLPEAIVAIGVSTNGNAALSTPNGNITLVP